MKPKLSDTPFVVAIILIGLYYIAKMLQRGQVESLSHITATLEKAISNTSDAVGESIAAASKGGSKPIQDEPLHPEQEQYYQHYQNVDVDGNTGDWTDNFLASAWDHEAVGGLAPGERILPWLGRDDEDGGGAEMGGAPGVNAPNLIGDEF